MFGELYPLEAGGLTRRRVNAKQFDVAVLVAEDDVFGMYVGEGQPFHLEESSNLGELEEKIP